MLSNASSKFVDGLTLGEYRTSKKAARTARLRDAYADVDLRDESRSRISGVLLFAGATDDKRRREHHHMVERSVDPTRYADAANILTVSAFEHELLTKHKLHASGDANQRDAEEKFCGVLLEELTESGWKEIGLI
jgi:hypothetical protein